MVMLVKNEDPEMRRTKKEAKIDENVVFTTINYIGGYVSHIIVNYFFCW